ncbi:MAG: peptide deformylase [Propionibacteriaceae bacterium]|jgi:peptide deformylase|nr:peptide deformylase [Propionibacteriaceae bacterium]
MPTIREWSAMGKIHSIVSWDEAVMHTETRPVTDFGSELQQLAANMFATMNAADGVGLAGPQIAVDLAIFVYNCPDEHDRFQYGVLCNPIIELPAGADRNFDASLEGCLSWPGAYQLLSRPDRAICRAQDEQGNPVVVHGTGLLARCLQHETDHLNGTVFADRLSNRSRRKLNAERESKRHLYPADWPIHPKGREANE